MAIHFYEENHTMKFNKGIVSAIVLAFAVAGLAGCEKGPMERAGEKADNAVEKAGDKLDNAADKVGDKVEQAGDKIKDATK